MIKQSIEIYRGDTKTLEVAIVDEAGNPVDLTNATVELGFTDGKDAMRYADVLINNNVVIITFSHELTKDITWTTGQYDLQVTRGAEVKTALRGNLIITKDITP